MSEYRNHNARSILTNNIYGKHVSAMTTENLRDKGEIAQELAARDIRIAELEQRNKELETNTQYLHSEIYDLQAELAPFASSLPRRRRF